MRPQDRAVMFALVCVVFWCLPASALHSGLADANGDTVFSEEFRHDYKAANAVANTGESVKPLLALLTRYSKPEEQAELQLSIGLVYNQRTGLVDPAKAVVHLSNALKYELPESIRLKVLVWRGGSREQLNQRKEALGDYLRVLLACSYHDLSGGWPEIKPPKRPIIRRSNDPRDVESARDYRKYREQIRFQRSLLTKKYFMVEAVRRVQSHASAAEEQVSAILEDLSPDATRHRIIAEWLKSENKRPWP